MSAPARRRERSVPAPQERRWPGLMPAPYSPARARIARALFTRAVGMVDVRVQYPDGRIAGRGDASTPLMRLVRPDAFFHRLGVDGKIGFGEAYMVGDWEADDLAGVLTAFAGRLTTLIPRQLQLLRPLYDPRHPDEEQNTLTGARENIHRHYDLSNELFALFLDETMTYSCAWFEGPDDTLEAAQIRKLDAILDMARVRPETRLLEIGTGWGSLAIRAASRGARVTTLTISPEQQQLARERVQAAGVADRVEVLIRDYRQIEGSYDAIASVEMLEAVGEQYWPAYFSALDRLLAPGGWAAVQTIVMPHDRLLASRHSYTWMHKYVFPGGLLPSVRAIQHTLRRYTGLRIAERRDMGRDYARTLSEWCRRFVARRDAVLDLGFDAVFLRMWEFYLSYCEAGFRSGYLDDCQFGLSRHH